MDGNIVSGTVVAGRKLMQHPKTAASLKEYVIGNTNLRATTGRIWHAIRIGRKRKTGLVMLGLAASAFLLAALFPALSGSNLPPLFRLVLWLVFGIASVWGGYLLNGILQPEQLLFQEISEACSRAARNISDPELLLNRITTILHTTLRPEGLTLWRYDDTDSVLNLIRAAGTAPEDDLVELPFDIITEQLPGACFVSTLPESALKQGLLAAGVQVVTTLGLGNNLIGLIGLKQLRRGGHFSRETFYRLDLTAGHLALIVKNALLSSDLNRTTEQLRLAYRRTIDTRDNERRNLATELHDDILGRLTAMSLTLRKSRKHLSANPAKVNDWLQNLEEEAQAINRRLREITQGLHPSVLTDLGLISAMRAYMDALAKQPHSSSTLKTISLTAQGFDQNRILPCKLERDLYYIIRQALDNAIAHAHAAHIFIHLRWGEETISVTVRDTGQGMKQPPELLMGHNGHLGLLSMHERSLAWHGNIAFHTDPNQGTTIHARLPIHQPSSTPTHLQAFTQYLN